MAGAVSSKPKTPAKGPSKLTKTYLLAYNVVQTLGWSYLLYQLITYYLQGSTKSLWQTVWWTVMIFQNAAVLEIVHTITGMVKSGILTTIMQVYSRVFLVLCVFLTSKASVESIGLPVSLLAWSITEIVRYGFYATNLMGNVPNILITLRYNLFYILYPMGVSGELWMMYQSQAEIASSGMWNVSLPNKWNFTFPYRSFLIGYMLSYSLFFPYLFFHMLKQRSKVYAPEKKTK